MSSRWGNRMGCFKITDDYIRQDPETVYQLLQTLEFIPIHIDFDYSAPVFKYTGLSPMFDEVPRGEETPRYEIICSRFPNGTHSFNPQRIETDPPKQPRRVIRL